MALDAEFKKHLHELMVEVVLELQDEEAHYKNALLAKAVQTHNGGAMPIAYKDAQLHAIESRVSKTIEKYIEAVSIGGHEITPAFEKDMINEFIMLTAGPKSIHFPPAIKGHQAQAVQGAFARERAQLTNRLVREGTNRLRELKMKMQHQTKSTTSSVTNLHFHAPVEKVYNNSVDHSVTTFTITAPQLQEIFDISEGYPELRSAASEIDKAQREGASALEKFLRWVSLLGSIEGLSERIYQHYPQIAALVGRAAMLVQHLGK